MTNIFYNKWLLIGSFFSALTVILIKYYENNNNILFLLVAVLSEIGLIYSYIQLLKNTDILTQFTLVKIISILMLVIPSIILFGNVLTIRKIFGLIFGIIAIYLLT
jgi:multidrug transporter EmrE-like cation transporter